jgi:hypothetical protein
MWEGLSDAQRADGLNRYAALQKDLLASGELIVSEALAHPSTGRRVMVTGGQTPASDGAPAELTVTIDGPYAELKEHLAGFFLIECETIECAVGHVAQVPEAALGLVEVRPVMTLSGWDM